MAITSKGFFASLTLIDEDQNETSKRYALTSATYAEAVTDVAAIVTALLTITEAVLAGYTIEQKFVEGALTPPTNDMPISEVVSATTTILGEGTKKANWSVPMPKDAIMSGNDLKIDDGDVLAYHALFQTGGEATLSDGETANVLKKGVRVSRSRRFE